MGASFSDDAPAGKELAPVGRFYKGVTRRGYGAA